MCSGELAAAAAATAAAARLRWRREAGWDPRFLLLVLEVLLAMALVIKFNAYSAGRASASRSTRLYSSALSAVSPFII